MAETPEPEHPGACPDCGTAAGHGYARRPDQCYICGRGLEAARLGEGSWQVMMRYRHERGLPELVHETEEPLQRVVVTGGACATPGGAYAIDKGPVPGLAEAARAITAPRRPIRWLQPPDPWELDDQPLGAWRVSLIGLENERRLAVARGRAREAYRFARLALPPLRSACRVLAGRPPYQYGPDDYDWHVET